MGGSGLCQMSVEILVLEITSSVVLVVPLLTITVIMCLCSSAICANDSGDKFNPPVSLAVYARYAVSN